MIVATARIIKLNISRKEETLIFKPKVTKKCNQVVVKIRPEGNAMTPDKKPSTAGNFLDASIMPPRLQQDLQSHYELIFKDIETVLLTDYKHEALTRR
jgi:hypothetical protein